MQQLVGGVARVVDAQAQVVVLVPQLDPRAARTSTPATDPGLPDARELAAAATAKTELDQALASALVELAVQVSPQVFGSKPTAGSLEPVEPAHAFDRFVREAETVLELMAEADAIQALVLPTGPGPTSVPATEAQRTQAAERVSRWRTRPVDLAFLSRVLQHRGVWQHLTSAADFHGRSVAQLEQHAAAQAAQTGSTVDVGTWDIQDARVDLLPKLPAGVVSTADAMRVFERLVSVDARARAAIVVQMHREGMLERFATKLPWGMVKELWESIPDKEASKLLEPFWDGKGGGASLGKRLDAHWYTRPINMTLDALTLGAKRGIDQSYDANQAGKLSDDDYVNSVDNTVVRTGVVGSAMVATGGAAGALAGGAAAGFGLGAGGEAVVGAAAGGAFGSMGGQYAGDVYDQLTAGKKGFDPISSYLQNGAMGGLMATALAPVGLAASKYLSAGMRTIAQQAAATHPELTSVLEAARAVGVGTSTTIRMKVQDILATMRGGGPPPGFRFAFAASGAIPQSLAKAPPEATVSMTIRPLQDLNTPVPMQMGKRGHAADLVEIESIDTKTGSLFDSHGEDASYRDDAFEPQPAENETEFGDGLQIKKPRKSPEWDPRRPHWRVSETHVEEDLEWAKFAEQSSYQRGQETMRGKKGSTRPDFYGKQFKLSVEVKNHLVGTANEQTTLVNKIIDQAKLRALHLPLGSRQGVVLDVRGQLVSPSKLELLRARIANESEGLIALDDVVLLTE